MARSIATPRGMAPVKRMYARPPVQLTGIQDADPIRSAKARRPGEREWPPGRHPSGPTLGWEAEARSHCGSLASTAGGTVEGHFGTRTERAVAALLVVGVIAALVFLLMRTGGAMAWPPDGTAPIKTLEGDDTGLNYPKGVALDAAGRMYVANRAGNGVVTAYAADWATGNTAPVKTLTGGGTGLTEPQGLAFDTAGQMYVSDDSNRVIVFPADWASGNTAPVKTLRGLRTDLHSPRGLAFDNTGRMYVANGYRGSDTVTAYAADWASGNTAPVKTVIGDATGLDSPQGLAFDAAGQLYVANEYPRGTYGVTAYAADWATGNTAPVKALTGSVAELHSPQGLAFDSAGQMYVTNDGNGGSNSVTVYAANWSPLPTPTHTLTPSVAPSPTPTETQISPPARTPSRQTIKKPPTTAKKGRRVTVPRATVQGRPLKWRTSTKKVCSAKKNVVLGKKKGNCRLVGSAPASALLRNYIGRFTIRIK